LQSKVKAPGVERAIRTIRTAVQRFFDYSGQQKWVHFLPTFIHSYNHRRHSTTKQRPIDVISDPTILVAQPPHVVASKTALPPIGSYVRLNRLRSIFDKEASGTYTEEVFRVTTHKMQAPIPMIRVEALDGEPVSGSLYPQEYQPVHFDPTQPKVDTVFSTRKKGHQMQYLVSFHGFPSSYRQWIDHV
jgi:hypothetical protein